jgi:hypothetical protein
MPEPDADLTVRRVNFGVGGARCGKIALSFSSAMEDNPGHTGCRDFDRGICLRIWNSYLMPLVKVTEFSSRLPVSK